MNDPPLPRYNRTNSVPRDVLASVVDDFNSGNPDLVRREWFGAISRSMITTSSSSLYISTEMEYIDGAAYDYRILLYLYIII